MIGIDIEMPKSCSECPISSAEEDWGGDWFFYCRPTQKALYGDKYHYKRYRKCPLKEVKEKQNE